MQKSAFIRDGAEKRFLFWAARAAGDEKVREVAHAHAATIIPLHRRADDSFIQSSTLDATGRLVKHYTHKGYSATSTWGRAQVWGILFSVMSYLSAPDEASWLEAAEAALGGSLCVRCDRRRGDRRCCHGGSDRRRGCRLVEGGDCAQQQTPMTKSRDAQFLQVCVC
jgi:hypothetical protein